MEDAAQVAVHHWHGSSLAVSTTANGWVVIQGMDSQNETVLSPVTPAGVSSECSARMSRRVCFVSRGCGCVAERRARDYGVAAVEEVEEPEVECCGDGVRRLREPRRHPERACGCGCSIVSWSGLYSCSWLHSGSVHRTAACISSSSRCIWPSAVVNWRCEWHSMGNVRNDWIE